MGHKVAREVTRINNYEFKWKIKTNTNKFQILSISKSKPATIIINNNQLNYSSKITTLGLTIGRCGISQHIKERAGRAGAALTRIKRFKNLKEKIIIHLYKALVKPVLEYPIIPICIGSKTNIAKLQSIQNRALYLAAKLTPPYSVNSRQLHDRYGMEAINVILYDRAVKIWNKLENIDHNLVNESMEMEDDDRPDHTWWRRVTPYIMGIPPEPKFVR